MTAAPAAWVGLIAQNLFFAVAVAASTLAAAALEPAEVTVWIRGGTP